MLGKWELLAGTRPTGFQTISRFLDLLDKGSIPLTDETKFLQKAFRQIIEGVNPADALQLTIKRGRPKGVSAARYLGSHYPIWKFVEAKLEPRQHGDLQKAISEAAKKFSKSNRRIEQIWAKYDDWKQLLRFIPPISTQNAALLKKHLTASELYSLPAAEGLALARRRAKTKK